MICFQRDTFTHIPGCKDGGTGDIDNYDYCYFENGDLPVGGEGNYIMSFTSASSAIGSYADMPSSNCLTGKFYVSG